MRRLREPRRISRTGENFAEGGFVAFIICAVITGICYGVFAIATEDDKSTAASNTELLKLLDSDGSNAKDLSEETTQRRKDYAQSYVDLAKATEKVNDTDHLGLSDDQWKQVKEVAKTGKPAKLDTKSSSYDDPFSWPFMPLWLLAIWLAIGIGALLCYSENEGLYAEHRMADVNWKRPSTWLVIFVFGPLVWIAMAISRVLLIWTPYPEVYREVDQRVEPDDDEWLDEPPAASETVTEERERTTYASSPVAARSTYIKVRTEAAQDYRRDRVKEVDGNIEYYTERARQLGSDLKETQTELNELRAERKVIVDAIDGDEVISTGVAGEEFDRIAQLPGVIATNVVNDRLRLIVRATHVYRGTTYDLGDWQIDVGADTTYIEAYEKRSGVQRTWGDRYPVYRLGRGLFCFGDREPIINEHFAKGQYLEALALAIECLNGVNKGERKYIPDAFYALTA